MYPKYIIKLYEACKYHLFSNNCVQLGAWQLTDIKINHLVMKFDSAKKTFMWPFTIHRTHWIPLPKKLYILEKC